jgi:hypothetical protein
MKIHEYAEFDVVNPHKKFGTVLITFNYMLYYMPFIYYIINAYMIRINHNLGLV